MLHLAVATTERNPARRALHELSVILNQGRFQHKAVGAHSTLALFLVCLRPMLHLAVATRVRNPARRALHELSVVLNQGRFQHKGVGAHFVFPYGFFQSLLCPCSRIFSH
jgi:hypothetical protein